jgi:hypothetical protein
VIEVELPDGTIVEFPDDTAPDVMKSALQKRFGAPTSAQPAPEDVRGPSGIPGGAQPEGFVGRTTAEPERLGLAKSFGYGLQKVGEGAAAVAGTPVDITTGGLNALIGLGNLFADSPAPYIENPVGGSRSIMDAASSIFPTIDESQVPSKQRMVGEAVDFGTQAALTGGGLALRAPAAMERAAQTGFGAGGSGTTKAIDTYARPYANNPVRTLAGDTAAGAGSGAAIEVYDQSGAQDAVASVFGETVAQTLGPMLAGIAGGAGGAGALSVTQGVGQAGVDMVRKPFGGLKSDYQIGGVNGEQPHTPTIREMQTAAADAQARAYNKDAAVRNLTANDTMLAEAGIPADSRPTPGAMSRDTGLIQYENSLRTSDPKLGTEMIERDKRVRTAVGDKVRSTAPAGAEGRDFTDFADAEVNRRIAQAEEAAAQDDAMVGTLAQEMEARAKAQQPAPQDVPVKAAMADMDPASRRIDEAFRTNYREARDTKNALYNDPAMVNAPVDAQELYDAVESIQAASSGPLSIGGGLPGEIVERVRSLVVARNEDTGAPEAFRDITYGDVQDLRAAVSEQIQMATQGSATGASGSGPRVQALRNLREVLDGFPDQLADAGNEAARAAIDNYAQNYRPRFREGQAGNLARDITRDPTGTKVRPEDTAGKFLGSNKGSDVESLNRAVPNNAADARTWLTGKLGESGVVDEKTGILRPDTLRNFATKNREVIARVPGMKDEIDKMLAQATQGQVMTGRIADDLKAISAARSTAEKETAAQLRARTRAVEKSPIGRVVGNDPLNAVHTVFSSGDAERAMEKLVLDTGPDKNARAGLKKSVSDWLMSSTTNSGKHLTADDNRPISGAKIENVFFENEKALAKVFDEKEMNALRIANNMMKMEANRNLQATSGSPTAERGWRSMLDDKAQNVLEAGLKLRYGMLKGGGIMRSLRQAAQSLPDGNDGVDRILRQMQSDPELAKHLLTMDVSKINTPDWNAKLNRILSAFAGVREAVSSDEEVLTIDLTPDDVKK